MTRQIFIEIRQNWDIVPKSVLGVLYRGHGMEPVGPLDYILDLEHAAEFACIGRARPGEAIKVLVYPGRNPSAKRIVASGVLSQNGQWFCVDFTTPDGERGSYPLNYQHLKHTLSLFNSHQAEII